jgi:hypothetical protein
MTIPRWEGANLIQKHRVLTKRHAQDAKQVLICIAFHTLTRYGADTDAFVISATTPQGELQS